MMTIHDLIARPPKLHLSDGALTDAWKLSDDELLFIDDLVGTGSATIETGAGCSTILFALKGAQHTSIVPDRALIDRILAYCDAHQIDTSGLTFVIEPSEVALPKIERTDFDLALIDGRHGFPQPFVDYYYLARALKIGGHLVVDDLHIWTCETLFGVLTEDTAHWSLVHESLGGGVFQKCEADAEAGEYLSQPYIRDRSRQFSTRAKARYLAALLRRRNWRLLRTTLTVGTRAALRGRWGDRGRR